MSEMIERMAKRLWDFDQEHGRKQFSNHVIFGAQWDNKAVPWEFATGPDVVDFEANQYRVRARAAIEAIREPTAGMIAIGAHEDHPESVKWIWSAMIDAALTGGK